MSSIPAVKSNLNIVQFPLQRKTELCISYIQRCSLKPDTFHKLGVLLRCIYSPAQMHELLRHETTCIEFTARMKSCPFTEQKK